MREKLLIKRRLLEIGTKSENAAYLVAKLINQFGVFVDKPELLSESNVKTVAQFFGTQIPAGFYSNPQDMQYFSAKELIIEQLISYINISLCGEYSLDEKVFERIEIFSKVLPNYKPGEELKIRKYSLITKAEADEFLKDLATNFACYTRPWSYDETIEFKWLYMNGFYMGQPLMCKDNAIQMFLTFKNEEFAKMLDLKDIVKMSLAKYGKKKKLFITEEDKIVFSTAIKNAKNCALSLFQAKYYNSLIKKLGLEQKAMDNSLSPYKKALALLKNNDCLGAAKEFAKNGSLLERNLVFLLSRATLEEASQILNLIKSDNPIVLMQLVIGVLCDNHSTPRTFSFYNYNKTLKYHTETEKEYKYRKSILSIGMKKYLVQEIDKKIKEYYSKKPTLGKIFIDEKFKKVGVPFNSSAMGMGLDVMPPGTRVKITADYVRTFCYWNNVFDIDMSVVFTHTSGELHKLNWQNFSKKEFGRSALTSGDNRKESGAEFNDFRIKELKKLGYKNAVVFLHGFGGPLNEGEIYCGYQNKKDLHTQAWSPKNMELKIHVKGDSRAYIAFAIDFETDEVIILNQILNSNNIIVSTNEMKAIANYLNKDYLTSFNMYKVLSNMGEVVEKPEMADVVFMEEYNTKEGQKLITPYDIEKLVNLLN